MSDLQDSALVLVTGATGFVGSHVTKLLVEQGFKVRAVVRDATAESKIKFLKEEMCPDAKHPVEIVHADLNKEEGWKEAMAGVTHVVHSAAPAPHITGMKEEDLCHLMVDGTKHVLQAAAEAGTVKRFVLTSSICTIYDQSAGAAADREADKPFTEADWTNHEAPTIDIYSKAKTLQEKTCWDFVKELPEEKQFELTVVNPGICVGPMLHKELHSSPASVTLIKRFMERVVTLMPPSSLAMVDVRDVAQAHLNALTLPDAKHQRHIIVAQNVSFKEIAQALGKEFKQLGYNVSATSAPAYLAWVNNLVDKNTKYLLSKVHKPTEFDTTRMKDILSVTPRDVVPALVETAHNLIQLGVVKKSKKIKKQETMEEAKTNGDGEVKENGESTTKENGVSDANEGENGGEKVAPPATKELEPEDKDKVANGAESAAAPVEVAAAN